MVAVVTIRPAIPNWSGQNRKSSGLAEKYRQIALIARERKDRLVRGGEILFSARVGTPVLRQRVRLLAGQICQGPGLSPYTEKTREDLNDVIAAFSALTEKYARASGFRLLAVKSDVPEQEWFEILNSLPYTI
jgi:hypothetical protein